MNIYRFTIALGLITLFSCSQGQTENNAQVKHVTANEFSELVEKGNGQLIDIRTPKEYNMGHIKGAKMIDFYAPTFKNYIDKLDKEKPVYIYCRSGNRSSKSVALLKELGFKEIINLKHGIIDWQQSGLELVK